MDVKIIVIILGMWVVTYLPRMLPIISLSKFTLPKLVLTWLSFIPVAVLSALLVPSLVLTDGQLNFEMSNNFLLAAIPAFAIAFWKRSLLLTVVVGMVGLVIIERLLV